MLVDGEPGAINIAPVIPSVPFVGATLHEFVFLNDNEYRQSAGP